MTHYQDVSLGILAGGRASRLGGVDKAFVQYHDQYLSRRILEMLCIDFSARFISTRTPDTRFSEMGLMPVLDKRADFQGPLAGMEALLETCKSAYLLSVPVDIKFIPSELIKSWLNLPAPPGIVLQDADGLQPLLALWHVETALPIIREALERNEKSVRGVLSQLNFKIISRTDLQIGNLNTPHDLETP